jgi:hypothetical protein
LGKAALSMQVCEMMTSTSRVSPSGKLYIPNSNKSTYPENLGENPPVPKKLHPFEISDKIRQNPAEGMQPDGKIPAGASVTSYQKNIKVLALGDPHTALLDTVESGSSSYESVSTDTVDSNKGSVDPHTNGTWQVVKSKKSHR